MQRPLILILLLALGSIVVFVTATDDDPNSEGGLTPQGTVQNRSSEETSETRSRHVSLPPIPTEFGDAPNSSAEAFVPPPPMVTLDAVQRQGLIGRDQKWVEELMAEHRWKVLSQGRPTTYENWNRVRMTFRYEAGVVVGARAEFPETALSADLTVLSEYFIGNGAHFPFHFESMDVPERPERRGRFRYADGKELYFRGRLRTKGEPPYGPLEFEISTRALDERPHPLLEDDEHASKQRVFVGDAGLP